MSVPFEEAKKLLKAWETFIVLSCSLCEKDKVLFRAEYSSEEGKTPTEILSGRSWEVTNVFRSAVHKDIRYFPAGKFAICHDCAEGKIAVVCEEAIRDFSPSGIKNIHLLARSMRRAA